MDKGFELPFIMPDEAYVGFLKCIKSDDIQLEAFATFVIKNFGKSKDPLNAFTTSTWKPNA